MRHALAEYRPTPAATAALLAVATFAGSFCGWLLPTVVDAAGPLRPSLPAVMSDVPLGQPVLPPAGSGGYRALHVQAGDDRHGENRHGDDQATRPVAWDPCRPITYVVRPDGAPPGGAEALDWAIARMAALTGFSFIDVGATREKPQKDRPAIDKRRYGDRWAPVLVAWTDPAEYPPIAGFAGLGGPAAVEGRRDGERRYVSGSVLLNREHLREVETWPSGTRRERAIILHELGHVMGLDHVDDGRQLMSRRPGVTVFDFADGDLRGVAAMSRGRCFRDF